MQHNYRASRQRRLKFSSVVDATRIGGNVLFPALKGLATFSPPLRGGLMHTLHFEMRAIYFIPLVLVLFLCGGVAQAQVDSEKWLLVEVTNASGEPLKRACVTVVPKDGEIVFRNADSRGRVKLKKPAAGNYRVVVKVDGYEAQKREVTIGSQNETVAFTLQAHENR